MLDTLIVVPVDAHVARMAGLLRCMYKTEIADSVIAATALFTGSSLVTRNIKDFRKIANITLKKI